MHNWENEHACVYVLMITAYFQTKNLDMLPSNKYIKYKVVSRGIIAFEHDYHSDEK